MKTFLSCCVTAALLVAGAQAFADETTTTTSSTSTTVTKEARQAKLTKDCIARHQSDNASTTVAEREQQCAAEVAAKLNAETDPR